VREFKITIDGEEFRVKVEIIRYGRYRVTLNDKTADVSVEEISGVFELNQEFQPESIDVERAPGGLVLREDTRIVQPEVEKAEKYDVKDVRGVAKEVKSVTAMLPGTVTKILVREGDEVKRGQIILVLEAMKMENEIASPADGVIREIRVKVGEKVDTGDILAVIG
jgi:biotin carboxyl carrier protein